MIDLSIQHDPHSDAAPKLLVGVLNHDGNELLSAIDNTIGSDERRFFSTAKHACGVQAHLFSIGATAILTLVFAVNAYSLIQVQQFLIA